MRRNGPIVLSGSAAVKADYQVSKTQSNQELWPYEWLFPPKYARRIRPHSTKTVASLTPGTQAVILSFTVPTGFIFVMSHIMRSIGNAAGFIEGSGSAIWVLDVNKPLGVTAIQGYPVPGFETDTVTLGSFNGQPLTPWPLEQPEVFQSLDLIQDKITITTDITDGIFYSCFVGYLVPNTRT